MVKKKKEIKIVRESEVNYTFLDLEMTDSKRDLEDGGKSNSNIDKDMIRTRSIDSKKVKIRYKNRIAGGQNQQGHSSVYE